MSYRPRTVAAPEQSALTEGALHRLEGWLADLRMAMTTDTNGVHVPTPRAKAKLAQPAERIIATVIGTTVNTVRTWLRAGDRRYPAGDARLHRLTRLGEVAAEIRSYQSQGIVSALQEAATDPTHPKMVNAATLLLPRLDPECWGALPIAVDVTSRQDTQDVYQIPQAVFDALTDNERDELVAVQSRIAADTARIDALLAAASARVPDSAAD